MKPISIWYHTILSGGTVPIDTEYAALIMQEQMEALTKSGLREESDEFYIGVNGDSDDANIARMLCPCPHVKILVNGSEATTEIPTLFALATWAKQHPDWYVLYFHIKSVTHPREMLYTNWRRRMERAVIWGWKNCVADLDAELDSAGAHWLTPEQFPRLVKDTPFWGGNFWWATSNFIRTLPSLPLPTWENRFEAEHWIGRGPKRPVVHDYCPGWP